MNAKISYSEIGRRIGLSSPAMAERNKKIEETGIICGYHVKVDHKKIGFSILAFIFLTCQTEKNNKLYTFEENSPEINECHCISGSESFLLGVLINSVSQLDKLIEKLSTFGETKTSIVLSSPVTRSSIGLNNEKRDQISS